MYAVPLMADDALHRWLPYRMARTDEPSARLFCMHVAGGSARMFLPWRKLLPHWIELCAVQLPGRERRIAEPLNTEVSEVTADFLGCVGHLLDRPFVLFGHSMGGLLAYDCAREIQERQLRRPSAVIVSATRAPDTARRSDWYGSNDVELVDLLVTMGGVTREVFDNLELRSILLAIFRADLALCDRYRLNGRGGIHAHLLALAGTRDRVAPPESVRGWQRYAFGSFEYKEVGGGHFFIDRCPLEVVEPIVEVFRSEVDTSAI